MTVLAPGRGRTRAALFGVTTVLTTVLLSVLVGLGPAAAASPQEEAQDLLGRVVTGTPQELGLAAPSERDGDEVVLTTQVVGVPDPRDVPQVAVATRTADRARLSATAAVTGAAEASERTAVLLVDTSGSMGPDGIAAAGRAAAVYADTVGPAVRVGLVTFADTATVLTPPTTDRTALRAGIAELASRGETALYDGLVLAARTAGPGGNVVVLSDGGDTVSAAGLDQAVAAVTGSELHVDAIAFNTAESAREPLDRIAAAGGGRVLQAADAEGLGRAFATAAATVPQDITITVTAPPDRRNQLPVAVALVVGGKVYLGAVDLPAATGPAPAAPLPVQRVSTVRPWWASPTVISGVLFVVLALVLMALIWPRDPAEAERRRRALALQAYGGPSTEVATGEVGSAAAGVLAVTERMVGDGGRQRGIALRLDRAGLTLLPHEWVVLRTSTVLSAAAALFLLVTPRWLGLAIGAVIGWLATEVWLRWRQARRCRAFADQLPDTLQVVASSLRSGFSFPQALAAAQQGAAQPMTGELGRALAAARLGVELEDELDRIAVRMRSEDWRLAVMAIRIQRSVGGSLAEVLATTSKTLRERAALFRHVRALSAEGRLSAYVLLGLPIGVGAFLFAFRNTYLEPLWTTVPGLMMIIIAVLGMVVGTAWMFKVAKVEV